jgi:pimeloyl-ACP methyl ester carboxylesterase
MASFDSTPHLARKPTRRGLLASTMASSIGRFARAAQPTTWVLVPGAWHGRWAFEPLCDALASLGHYPIPVCLSGVGERSQDQHAVTLQTHIDNVIEAIPTTATPVSLLGHSYAGMVITGAATQSPTPIAHLVYLDAFVPQAGDSFFSLMKPAFVSAWKKRVGANRRVPPMLSAKQMGLDDVTLAHRVDERLTAHPLQPLEDVLHYDVVKWRRVSKTFIRCTRNPSFENMAHKALRLGCTVKTIDAGHDAMLSHPNPLAQLLHGL